MRIAINGFGRIGRLIFRQMFGRVGYEIVAINDMTSPKILTHLLKYDLSEGEYVLADTISADENSITVDGKVIKIYKEPDVSHCPWAELKIDAVVECTCSYIDGDKMQAHIDAGAKNVIFPGSMEEPLAADAVISVHQTKNPTVGDIMSMIQ